MASIFAISFKSLLNFKASVLSTDILQRNFQLVFVFWKSLISRFQVLYKTLHHRRRGSDLLTLSLRNNVKNVIHFFKILHYGGVKKSWKVKKKHFVLKHYVLKGKTTFKGSQTKIYGRCF